MGTPQELKDSAAYKTVRRKFSHSIIKWSAADGSVNEEQNLPNNPPDVGDLVNLLRSIGFKLRQFDKCGHGTEYSMSTFTGSLHSIADGLKNSECRVEITCGKSGLRAILESAVGECRCPPMENTTQAEFWEVTGSAPVRKGSQESINSVQEAGSSLVPPLPPAVASVVKEVMFKVLQITCDPDIQELDTSGSSRLSLSHHSSLGSLPLTHSSTRQYGSTTEISDSFEQDNKKLLPRTISNMELSTCPVSESDCPGDLIKHTGTWNRQSSSPTSILSESLKEISLTGRNDIHYRLECARRSICEVMSILDVQPFTIDTAKKIRLEVTPTSQARKSGHLKTTDGTQKFVNKLPITPGQLKKISGTPGHAKKTPVTAGHIKKTPVTPGHINKTPVTPGHSKKISGIPASTKKTSEIPTPRSSLAQALSSISVASSVSEPGGIKLPAPLSKSRKKSITQPKSQCEREIQLVEMTDDAVFHTSYNVGTNISTESSSSASSTKARKLINAVRRVSRISSSGGTSTSKSSEKGNN